MITQPGVLPGCDTDASFIAAAEQLRDRRARQQPQLAGRAGGDGRVADQAGPWRVAAEVMETVARRRPHLAERDGAVPDDPLVRREPRHVRPDHAFHLS